MKTSEIAAFIEARNIKVFVGWSVPFYPMAPLPAMSRTRREVGWCAFNIIRSADPELVPSHGLPLCVNRDLEAFACLNLHNSEGLLGAWEVVEWDGYGGLETWKEVFR
jgi:hypothetical protein